VLTEACSQLPTCNCMKHKGRAGRETEKEEEGGRGCVCGIEELKED